MNTLKQHSNLAFSVEKPTTVSREDLFRIIFGIHDDPFSVLGYHYLPQDEDRAEPLHVIRAFVPDASELTIIDSENIIEANCVHHAGFFEVTLSNPPHKIPYEIQVRWPSGRIEKFIDPYCFGTVLTEFDRHLIGEGKEEKLYEKLGAHLKDMMGISGVHFAVWAPNAKRVSVVGDFNRWNGRRNPMRKLIPSGIWEIFIPNIGPGAHYKYEIVFPTGHILMKADPMAFASELRPGIASIVTDLNSFTWNDHTWLDERPKRQAPSAPLSIYEVHLGSWRQPPEADPEAPFYNYRDLAHQLVAYVRELGYTHIELMPVMEHLLDASWGYQVTGYFAPTSRYGSPEDFKYFVDYCHQHEIGVIMDWVPAHFPKDYTALARFDGTALYEHLDPRHGFHPQWGTYIFNYERNEVRNFLINSALFWLREYHLDGLRVDAVASMLYHDFGRKDGEWLPNKFGGRENLEAIAFLREMNQRIHEQIPGAITIAEESTSWPMVSRPVYVGGLGFDLKWNMGWMNDFLKYMQADPIFRKFQHNTLTWSLFYAFSENFLLPLSHDEVVHLKKSIFNKMPGDYWKKVANVKLCYGFQYGHPGKKLLFMGGEFGQWHEWTEKRELQWELLKMEEHKALQHFVKQLNAFYKSEPAMWEDDFSSRGFEWIDFADADFSIISFLRKGTDMKKYLIWAFNFTPVPRHNYRIGVPFQGEYQEVFNSDASQYGGSGVCNTPPLLSIPKRWQRFSQFVEVSLPPLGFIILKSNPDNTKYPNKTADTESVNAKKRK